MYFNWQHKYLGYAVFWSEIFTDKFQTMKIFYLYYSINCIYCFQWKHFTRILTHLKRKEISMSAHMLMKYLIEALQVNFIFFPNKIEVYEEFWLSLLIFLQLLIQLRAFTGLAITVLRVRPRQSRAGAQRPPLLSGVPPFPYSGRSSPRC